MAIKLGLGPYEHRQPEAPSTVQARIHFMRVVEEVEPRAVSSLHDSPFIILLCFIYLHFQNRIEADKTLAEQTAREARRNLRRHITPDEIKEVMPSWEALTSIEGGNQVVARLQEWAESWHLQERWCLDYAVRAMRMWLASEYPNDPPSWWEADLGQFEEGGSLMVNAIWDNVSMRDILDLYKQAFGVDKSLHGDKEPLDGDAKSSHDDESTRGDDESSSGDDEESSHGFNFEYEGFSYQSRGWSPFFDEIGEWRARTIDEFLSKLESFRSEHNRIPRGIKQAFKHQADEHVKKLKSAALKLGLRPAPKKFDIKHFRWLVYYQVQKPNWSYERIAKEYGTDIKTVSSGVKSTARLIGLKLRSPLPAGRKPRPA